MSQESSGAVPGGYRELISLSLPLVLSSSFATLQVFIDRVFIAKVGGDAVGAAMPAVAYFWTPFALLFFTVMYATVFVAQYGGAGRPKRIGAILWQSIYFALLAGLLYPLIQPIVFQVIESTSHTPRLKELEGIYFQSLCWSAMPMLLVGAVTGFFAGRGQSWTVLLINSFGSAVNALCAYPLIYLQADNPNAAMAGAGWAAALGSWAATIFGLILIFQKKYRDEFDTLRAWRFEPALFFRFLRFGFPNGLQWMIEGIAFTVFIAIVGNLGKEVAAATTLTLSLNMLTFLPIMGLGQGVEILVGQRQGEEKPDLSAKTTWTGAKLATIYMTTVAVLYCTIPNVLCYPFSQQMAPEEWASVGLLVPFLLRFVAAYSLVDGINIILAYALRGAGDTRFVVLVAVSLSWPLMVIPTYFVVKYQLGVEWAWSSATLYLAATAALYVVRFLGGKWRTMKVIEATVAETESDATANATPVEPVESPQAVA